MKFLFAAILLLAVGCKAPPKRVVRIESDPVGMRVFYGVGPNEQQAKKNREYVGVTPCDYTPEHQNSAGKFDSGGIFVYSDFVQTAHVFWCEPSSSQTNLFPKFQVFHGDAAFQPASMVPGKVFFDLTTPQAETEPKAEKTSDVKAK